MSLNLKLSQSVANEELNASSWVRDFVAVLDAEIWTSVLPIAGVFLGVYLTHKFALRTKAHEDNRDRLIGAAMDSLQCANEMVIHFRDVAYHGPRGGGKIRDSTDPEADWTDISPEEAKEHDFEAGEAIGRLIESQRRLREFNIVLSVFGPVDLTKSFEAIPDRVTDYFNSIAEDGTIRGEATGNALYDIDALFVRATEQVRRITAPKKTGAKSHGNNKESR